MILKITQLITLLRVTSPSIAFVNSFSPAFPPGFKLSETTSAKSSVKLFLLEHTRHPSPRGPYFPHHLSFSSNSTDEIREVDNVDNNIDQLQATIEKLRNDCSTATMRAKEAEENVLILREKITEAEADLLRKSDFWEVEKRKLLERINNATSFFLAKEADLKSSTNALLQEGKTREDELKAEIAKWRAALTRAQLELEDQQNGAMQLKERLLKAEDQLEFEQMNFQKQTEELTKRITEETAKLAELEKEKIALEETSATQKSKLKLAEGNLETEKKSFEAERRRLEEKVEYSERIINLKRGQMYNRYKKIRQEMGGLLEAIKSDARREQSRLNKKIKEKNELITSLQSQLDSANQIYKKFDQLQDEIRRQKEAFTEERDKIQREFTEKLEERDGIISELKQEISSSWEKQRSNEIKIKELEEQANVERREMKWMLELARNDTVRLKAKHKAEISEMSAVVTKLRGELSDTRGSVEQLDRRLVDMTWQRDKKAEDLRKLDFYVVDQDSKMLNLSRNILKLEREVEERESKITTYESSYREMAKLSINLTGRRIRSAGSRVSGLFRRIVKK
jgi:chromosome segregation ATPase